MARVHDIGQPAPPAVPPRTIAAPSAPAPRPRQRARGMAWTARLLIGLVGLLVVAGLALAWAHWQWRQGTQALRGQLHAARLPLMPKHFDRSELAALPAPVQRYLGRVLKEGQPLIALARFTHSGSFNLAATQPAWAPFRSDQIVVTQRPGFDWDGRIAIGAGLSVRVHDAYVAGEGLLLAKPMGLFAVARLRGTPEMAQGELMRYLAEAPWYPSVLLPSQGVRWQAVDADHAHATLIDGATSVGVTFGFGADGLIDSVAAAARARTVGDRTEMTPWQVRLWNYAERDGVLVPLEGEVAWLLPSGPYPYWRGRLESISYEPAR